MASLSEELGKLLKVKSVIKAVQDDLINKSSGEEPQEIPKYLINDFKAIIIEINQETEKFLDTLNKIFT